MEQDRWEKLEVWNISDELAIRVYKIEKDFPKEEIYGITSQLRRSALSVPTNLVEGYSRRGDKELSRFTNISFGSLAETKYLLYFSYRLDYIERKEYEEVKSGYESLGKKLWKFYEAIN